MAEDQLYTAEGHMAIHNSVCLAGGSEDQNTSSMLVAGETGYILGNVTAEHQGARGVKGLGPVSVQHQAA